MSESVVRRDSWPQFIRDVGCNVLANLIAVPILYLLGLLAGVFPRQPRAVASVLILIVGMAVLLGALGVDRLSGRRYLKAWSWIFGLSGFALIVIGGVDFALFDDFSRGVLILVGSIATWAGVRSLRRLRAS